MKLLRSLLRIATTVCICMAIIACVTIVVRPQVLRDWPGDYGADPVVQLTGNFTPIRLAHVSSGTLPVVQSAPAEMNLIRPSDSAKSSWVLAESQPDSTNEPSVEPTIGEPLDTFQHEVQSAPATVEPQLQIDALPETLGDLVSETDTGETELTTEALPEGGRVRIDAGNGTALEADSIELRNFDRASDRPETAPETTAVGKTYATAGDNPIPEFLRGRELPPLGPGQKVVTVQVPVDNWVDLAAGDIVRVESEVHGRGVESEAELHGTLRLTELERVEIYALPGIAPENTDIVPVCLKVNAPQARLLIKLRASKTPVRLMVVKSAHADHAPSPTAGTTRVPLRSEDEFTGPSPARTPPSGDVWLPEAEPTPVADPIDLRNRDDFPAPAARLNAEFQPAIEPSEEGTVVPLDGKALSLSVETVQVVESEYRIRRVSGFDAKVIRVSALGPAKLKIEGLAQGRTSFRVEFHESGMRGAMLGALNVSVLVGPKAVGHLNIKRKTYEPDMTPYSAPMATMNGLAATVQKNPREEAEETLRKLYPKAGLEFIWLRDSLILRGTVTNADEILQIVEIAEQFAPKVFNQLAVKHATTAPIDDQSRKQAAESHIMVLTLPGDRGSTLAPRQRVDVIEQKLVRNQTGRDEAMERIIAKNVEVADLQVGPDQVLVHLRVNEEIAFRLSDIDPATLQVVPHGDDVVGEQPTSPRHTMTMLLRPDQVPGLKLNQSADVFQFSFSNRGKGIEQDYREVVRGVDVIQLETNDDEVLVTLRGARELTEVMRGIENATLLLVPHGTSPSTVDAPSGLKPFARAPAIDPAQARANPDVDDAMLRNDIRSLHDDVRKLITLLEKRAAVTPSEYGGPMPKPQDNAAVVGQDIAQFPDRVWTRIGLKFTPVSPETAVEGNRSQRQGLRIDDVRADSPAALAGIQAGDVLVGADRYEVRTAENLQYALNQTLSRGVRTLEFAIKRQSAELKASVELGSVQLQPSPGTTIGPAVFSKP